jgi:hypothetical protein
VITLMRMTIPGPWSSATKTKTTELGLDLLRQADCLSYLIQIRTSATW